jgi:hypothetical protein
VSFSFPLPFQVVFSDLMRALDEKVDGDDPNHLKWIYETALARAKEFSITGITYTLTQGVVKNIIPAIASTNAIVAGLCALFNPVSLLRKRSLQDCHKLLGVYRQLHDVHW